MKAYTWFLLGGVGLACGGGAFSSAPTDPDTNGGSENGEAGETVTATSGSGGSENGTAGDVASAGSADAPGTGGSSAGSAGAPSMGGMSGGGIGGFGIAGDLVIGGMPNGTAGTGGAPVMERCPTTPPVKDGACKTGLSCTYGADLRLSCRPRATCTDGKWQLMDPGCKQLHACEGVNANAACSMDAAACIRSGSQYCTCTACEGTLCMNQATWHCYGNEQSSCAKIAPNEGQACNSDGNCTYGRCGVAQQSPTLVTCSEKAWSWEPTLCPLAQ